LKDLPTQIAEAFRNREKPAAVVIADHPPTDEYEDAMAFENKTWQDVKCVDWDAHPSAVFGFSPDAFCYFLPGICVAGIKENRPDLLANNSLITTLDRGNAPSSWDEFFRSRWPSLSAKECEAVQGWILWLTQADPPVIPDAFLSRAYDTLTVIANKNHATPMAGRAGSPKK
jgi:hypothetical protein